MTISPSGIISVCSGDQLELTCTITDSRSFALLRWNVTLIPENATTPKVYDRTISSSSPSDQTAHLMINYTTITFSRISARNSFPFISRLLINPVSSSLNGAEINCVDAMTAESSPIVVINVTRGYLIRGRIIYYSYS